MRTGWLTVGLLLFLQLPAAAEWQIRPFIGFTFAGATTFVDPEDAAGRQNPSIGVSGGWLGDIFGVEGDFGRGSGFFEAGNRRVLISSGVNTLTANVVIALPRRMAEYSLRPYFVGGAGAMYVSTLGTLGALPVTSTLPAMNIGGGVTGFLTNRIGLSWDVRRFSSLRGEGETRGQSLLNEQLSFWRATMAVAVRY
jgi:hypothetical protein